MLFASGRERRLWILALLVVAGIFATLWLGPALLDVAAPALVSSGFWLGLGLIGVSLLVLGLRARPRIAEVGVVIGVLGAYLVLALRLAVPGERSHLIEYAIVAVLVHEALEERAARGRSVALPSILAFSVAVGIGALDEGMQLLVPGRVFDPVDTAFNTTAAALAVVGGAALRWLRQRGTELRSRRIMVPAGHPDRPHTPGRSRSRD